MKADGLDMDRMTYGVLMFLHSRKGDHDECIRVNQQMEAVRACCDSSGALVCVCSYRHVLFI